MPEDTEEFYKEYDVLASEECKTCEFAGNNYTQIGFQMSTKEYPFCEAAMLHMRYMKEILRRYPMEKCFHYKRRRNLE